VLAMLHPVSLEQHAPRHFAYRREYIAQDHLPKDITDWVWIDLDFPDDEHVVSVLHPAPDLVAGAYHQLGYDAVQTKTLMGIPLQGQVLQTSPPGVTIRPVRPEDDLARIGVVRFDNPLPPDVLDHPRLSYVMAEVEGHLAGHARLVHTDRGIGYLAHMEVLEPYRRRGIGTALARELHRIAQEAGMDRVVAVPSGMIQEAAILESLGYERLMPMMLLVPVASRRAAKAAQGT